MDAINPYATPAAPLNPEQQRQRQIWTRELKSARIILIIVGILQFLFGAWHVFQVREAFEEGARAEVQKMGPGYILDTEKLELAFEEQKLRLYALSSLPALFGVFLFVMAALVFRYPVGVTLSSLLVFCAIHLANGIIDPAQLARGILLKVIFVVVLFKAWQSARKAKAVMN